MALRFFVVMTFLSMTRSNDHDEYVTNNGNKLQYENYDSNNYDSYTCKNGEICEDEIDKFVWPWPWLRRRCIDNPNLIYCDPWWIKSTPSMPQFMKRIMNPGFEEGTFWGYRIHIEHEFDTIWFYAILFDVLIIIGNIYVWWRSLLRFILRCFGCMFCCRTRMCYHVRAYAFLFICYRFCLFP